MNELEIRQVPFMGAELVAARDADGQIWAGIRWLCDGVGLNRNQRDNQIKKIQADAVLSKGAGNLTLPTKGGMQKCLCLKLDYVPLWLAKIAVTPAMKNETPELAEKLVQYQLKAKDVLAAAFLQNGSNPDFDMLSEKLMLLIGLDRKWVEQERVIQAIGQKVRIIRDVMAVSAKSWRRDTDDLIGAIAQKFGGREYIEDVSEEIFRLVDARAEVTLGVRLLNKRRKMVAAGASKTACEGVSKIDVIADDKKLIEIYMAIVKELAIKYGVGIEQMA